MWQSKVLLRGWGFGVSGRWRYQWWSSLRERLSNCINSRLYLCQGSVSVRMASQDESLFAGGWAPRQDCRLMRMKVEEAHKLGNVFLTTAWE